MNPENIQKAPSLICGMHRSGTSMIAQMLSRCGLYLGEESHLMDAHAEDNPAGFWEFNAVVEFSDRMLATLHGAWDNPLPFKSQQWMDDIPLAEARQEALELLEPLTAGDQPWGWKDPRLTVMLPFWKSVFPDLQVILCLRNPIEVAYSLSKRHTSHADFDRGLSLWRDYHEIFQRDIGETALMVTHYEAAFYQPQDELARLCQFAGLSPTEEQLNQAAAAVEPGLYRGIATASILDEYPDLPYGLLDLYAEFSAQAGEIYRQVQNQINGGAQAQAALQKLLNTSTTTFDQYNSLIKSLKLQAIELDYRYKKQKDREIQRLNEKDKALQKLRETLENKTRALKIQNHHLSALKSQNHHLNALTSDLRTRLAEKEQEVLFYALSQSWRMTRPLRKFKKIFTRK